PGGAGLAPFGVQVVEVAVEDLDVGAEEPVAADADAAALALDHQVVVELGAIADLDPRPLAAALDVAVAAVKEGRVAPTELHPLPQPDLTAPAEEDRLQAARSAA